MDVLEERERKGLKDEPGKEPGPLLANKSSVELGTEIQTRLLGAPATGKYITFAPAIDQFLKGHLFGDIFGRDNLDFQSRELATISALANIEGVNPQLQSHFGIGLNVGLTEAQMRGLIAVLGARVGGKQADNAEVVLGKVLKSGSGAPPVAAGGKILKISVSRKGSQPSSKGAAEYFTGSVRVDPLFKANDPLRASGGRVTFEPDARTAWHTHPFGQVLIVTAGSGWVQQWDGPVEEIREGDVVRITPGLKHWHGATATTTMTHIAIQEQLDGQAADWLEKVSDEQYNGK